MIVNGGCAMVVLWWWFVLLHYNAGVRRQAGLVLGNIEDGRAASVRVFIMSMMFYADV